MNKYRTHNCSELRIGDTDKEIKISGWVHRTRDHGNLIFIDLRDHYGITQCVTERAGEVFKKVEKVKQEFVVTIIGKVVKRNKDTVNKDIPTGEIEVKISDLITLSQAKELPMPVFGEQEYPEDIRLKYRFLDLRRKGMHENILLRSKIISSIRSKMQKIGFNEFQTPILTASSPEGARDFLVPSRIHQGQFYALPQAPQQFKQMVMVAGFDKYFQIAPCFRDEDSRADRSPGEHYQFDIEMSFVEQNDIFNTLEPIFFELFSEFSKNKIVSKPPFKRIKYKDALLIYGTDKPDLRNPIKISDLTEIFKREDVKLEIFKKLVKKGCFVRGIPAPKSGNKPRSFFDNLNNWAKEQEASGLGYISFSEKNGKLLGEGPIAKFFSDEAIKLVVKNCNIQAGDSLFFSCAEKKEVERISGLARQKIAEELNMIDNKKFEFCWIIDFPMYQYNKEEKKIEFSHNPFSMPQTSLEKFDSLEPLDILAYQYDLVCNGVELSSGAIRNHLPELMFKVFSKVGYSKKDVENKFTGMIKALSYGAPPHGGIAPGIERIVMLLADTSNIREVTLFPLNQKAEDLLMSAPSKAEAKQLKELGIKLDIKKN